MYKHISRYGWSVAILALLAAASAIYLSTRQTPIYEAEASVRVLPAGLVGERPGVVPEPNLRTEQTLAESRPVAQRVVDSLGLTESADDVRRYLAVDVVAETDVLLFAYEHPDSEMAAEMAQAFADAYLELRQEAVEADVAAARQNLEEQAGQIERMIKQLSKRLDAADRKIERQEAQAQLVAASDELQRRRLEILELESPVVAGARVEEALAPRLPVRPNHRLNGVLGLVLGLLIGVAQAEFRGRLSRRIWSIDELETITDRPLLGSLPVLRRRLLRRRDATPLFMAQRPAPLASIEAVRFLRESVVASASSMDAKVLLVTSVGPGEGRTTVSFNVALASAKAGMNVVFVSADVRRHTVDEALELADRVGLIDVLTGQLLVEEATVAMVAQGLRILPRGRKIDDPADLLASSRTRRLFAELRDDADLIIIDSAPASGIADTFALASSADAAILVVDARTSDAASVATVCRQLEQVKIPLLGSVFNHADISEMEMRSYYRLQESLMHAESERRDLISGAVPERPAGSRS